MADAVPFEQVLTSVDDLRSLYRQPHPLVVEKERPTLDPATRRFIDAAPFLVLATHDAAGNADVSPRGGEPGFVRTIDDRRLVIGDLGGNNRLDSLQNIVATNQVALIFVHPGRAETVRVNGRGWVTTDPDVLQRFAFRTPAKSAIGVEVAGTYIHCAKAFLRSQLWEPDTWAAYEHTPDAAEIIACQRPDSFTADGIRTDLAASYAAAMANERGATAP